MTYVLKSVNGCLRELGQSLTWKWHRSQSFPSEQAALDFKNQHPELKDFAIVPMRGEK